MSTNDQAAHPSTIFTAIFDIAEHDYKKLTGKNLRKHPIAAQFDSCDSPEDVIDVLQTHAQAFSKFGEGDKELMKWLNPTVHILFTFSAALEKIDLVPFSPATKIFTGIGVLLGAARDDVVSHDSLIQLFERIQCFLQRMGRYMRNLFSDEFAELLAKIMAQILSILALSTKVMTDGRISKILRRMAGRRDIEDAISRLDALTREENLMVVAKSLELLYELKRTQLGQNFRTWLSPPDPSINHNTACKIQHDGTARWFIEGDKIRDWKKNGSLLWICGNPGAGKSVLCSAIIEDIKSMRKATPASIAYYYFDYKDASKRDIRGFLTSILFQLGNKSDRCWDALYKLYVTCSDGSEQPSDAALAKCLGTMLKLPGQLPIFIVVDALDECPRSGTPSAREEVLSFVDNLIRSRHSKLFICITSRPEQDICAVLKPLTSTSASSCVSLHEEGGQRKDIETYVRSFVNTDTTMRKWREEDRELVITTLSERAGGMFRWVFCQLDTLRRRMPSSIRKALDELPTTLDDTYKQMLQGIPKEQKQHAYHLFQCLVVAARPLCVEELAEIFAIDFDTDVAPSLKEGWRPEDPEEAVLSACSTLIAIIEDKDSKIVQFSHFSVKEFLTSDRLRTSAFGDICHYFIPLDAAHTVLVRACTTVLLQLDENVDKERLATYPLVFYAADHWVDHVEFGDVASRVQDTIEQLFDPSKPYLAAWVWIRNMDGDLIRGSIGSLPKRPPPPEASALYYAALCGHSGLSRHLITAHAENVNAKCGYHGSPLHAAVYMGHLDAARVLINHGADVNLGDQRKRSPLLIAYNRKDLGAMRLLLEHGGEPDVQRDSFGLISHDASFQGRAGVLQLLLRHKADVNSRNRSNRTPLHWASWEGHTKVVELLLDYGADINAQSNSQMTPLREASEQGRLETVHLLLEHGADVHIRGEDGLALCQVASSMGHAKVAQLLLEHGAEEE
ncbi:hypothetical protein BC826DRAFT_1109310 [Russula brevipes]|nr:hypothetical protein BC826DRAFT_1109310 [Russula brevipes]